MLAFVFVFTAALLLSLGVVWMSGCAHHEWRRLEPDCATGQVWHVDDDLICYGPTGGPFVSRKWSASDTPESACRFCREWGW